MSREVRRVPATWEHPKDERGRYIPLFGSSWSKRAAQWDEENEKWEKGFRRGGSPEGWIPKKPHLNYPFSEWDGERPKQSEYMPEWPESERTHWQMYQTTSEGTPISPVMDTPENLARWLADNNASAFAGMGATYEEWLGMILRGHSIGTFVVVGGVMKSGVAASGDLTQTNNL